MDHVYRKKITSCCSFLLFFSTALFSQNGYKTIVKLTDLSNEALLNNMQRNATELLTEMNEAFFQNREPNVKSNVISDEAKEILSSLWATSPIRCIETQIIEKVLKMKRGDKYQVRNIPVFVKNIFYYDTTKHYYEICLTFNGSGVIENIFYSINSNVYESIINEGNSELEKSRREFILEFIENYKTAFNRKDIEFMQKFYNDKALIVTGDNIKIESNDTNRKSNTGKNYYQTRTKKEYVEALGNRIFKNNKYLDIVFDDIKIAKDLKYEDIYGVNLKQYWNASGYKDVGYLFLMIDFKDENNPIILIRTLQSEGAEKTKEGIYGLHSFDIVR